MTMTMMRRVTPIALLLCALGLTSCTRSKSEAVLFCRLLQAQSEKLDTLGKSEVSLAGTVRPWAHHIKEVGMYPGDIEKTRAYLQDAVGLQAQSQAILSNIEALRMQSSDLRSAQADLLQKLRRRSASLEQLTSALQTMYQHCQSLHEGQLYIAPEGVDAVVAAAGAYFDPASKTLVAPSNPISPALAGIRASYGVTDADLQGEPPR